MLHGFSGRMLIAHTTLAAVIYGFISFPALAQDSTPAITAPAISEPLTPAPATDTDGNAQQTSDDSQPPKLSPAFQQALLAYTNGLAALDRNDYNNAIEAFNYAIKLKPDDPQFHFMAAKAYEGAGKFRGEWFHLRKAVRLQVNHQEAAPLFLRMWQTALDKNILNVGSPLATVKAALGEPDAQQTQNTTIWQYGFMGVEFVDDKVVGVMDLRGTGTPPAPQETVAFKLNDDREWVLKLRSAARTEFKLIYAPAKATDMAEIVTNQRLIGLGTQMTVSELVDKMHTSLQYEFPEVHWQVLDSSDKDALLAWWLDDDELLHQYEVVRLMAGENDIHRLAYTSRGDATRDNALREQWINQLRNAKLVPLAN